MKNLCAKTRKVNEPYEVYRNNSGWEWRVLKKYCNDKAELNDPYARYFCAVKSPMTHGHYDLGDVYASEVKSNAKLIPNPTIEPW